MTQRVIKFRIIYYNKINGYERLTPDGWEWMALDMNPEGRESWHRGVFPYGYYYKRNQFSGLTDKHGKEIYEGDRLRGEFNKKGQRITKERYGTVVFAFGGFHVIYDDEPKSHYNMTYKYRFEVIGNIYSNPELVDPKMIER